MRGAGLKLRAGARRFEALIFGGWSQDDRGMTSQRFLHPRGPGFHQTVDLVQGAIPMSNVFVSGRPRRVAGFFKGAAGPGCFTRPSGTEFAWPCDPALKRRATFGRPSGTTA